MFCNDQPCGGLIVNPDCMLFKNLPPRALFMANGIRFKKASTRTARALEAPHHTVWFKQDDLCELGKYSPVLYLI